MEKEDKIFWSVVLTSLTINVTLIAIAIYRLIEVFSK